MTPRTIDTLLDPTTGKLVDVEKMLAALPMEADIFLLRRQIEERVAIDDPLYICVYCKQAVVLRGTKNFSQKKDTFYFAHRHRSDSCIIKTTSHLTKEEILAIQYNGVKESRRHIELKELLAAFLTLELGQDRVAIEKVRLSSSTPGKWRKPDVLAEYGDKTVAFELQLSTTFLTVIVDRAIFYRNEGTFLIWVFDDFSEEEDRQKFTQKDVYYNNRQNVFIFDNEAQQHSSSAGKLVLKCLHKKFSVYNKQLVEEWDIAFVSLADLIFKQEDVQCYYVDSEWERLQGLEEIEREEDLHRKTKQEEANALKEQWEKERLRKERIKNEVKNAKAYLKDVYTRPNLRSSEDPIDNMSLDALNVLNAELDFKDKRKEVLAKLFKQRDNPDFLKYLSQQRNIQLDYNLIHIEDVALLQYLMKLDDRRVFAFYMACLFSRFYRIDKTEKEYLDGLFDVNKAKRNDDEINNIWKWGIVNLLQRFRAGSAFELIKQQHLMLTLESLRLKYPLNYKYDSFLQVTHSFLDKHEEHAVLYLQALRVFDLESQVISEDRSGKLRHRLQQISTMRLHSSSQYQLVWQLFPDLF